MGERIVITGASGQYGRLATDRLIAQGRAADLILITRSPGKLADRASQGCEVRFGDFDQPASLGPALAGADRMLLISGTRVGARVVQHDGEVLTPANIGPRLATRDLMADLRAANPFLQGGGAGFTAAARSRFLQALDRALTQALRGA